VLSYVATPQRAASKPDGDPLSASLDRGRAFEPDSFTISTEARRLLAAESSRTESTAAAAIVVTHKPDADGVDRKPDGDGVARVAATPRAGGGLMGLPDHEHPGDGCGLCNSFVASL